MYVVGYPKSGNTWLCYLLAYSLNVEFDDYDNPGIYPTKEHLRKLVKGGHAHKSFIKEAGEILKTHKSVREIDQDLPIIYLVRDGRDVMTSYYHYEYAYKRGQKIFEPGMPLKSRLHRARWKLQTTFVKSDFSQYLRKRGPEWGEHVMDWLESEQISIIKYEDMIENTSGALRALYTKLGLDAESTVIDKAVDVFCFDRMTGRNAGKEEKGAFFRKGVAGDWINHFSKDDEEYFESVSGAALKRLGYI